MLSSFKALLTLLLVASGLGCTLEDRPAPPSTVAQPEAPAAPTALPAPEYPEPPPLTGDPSHCVMRSYIRGEKAWDVKAWVYDPDLRTLQGDWMHFDAQGRMTKRADSSDTLIHTYDSHGNLAEEAHWANEKLVEGTRWQNRYAGSPARIVAIDLSDFRKPKERKQPRTRMRFAYDASGRVASMTRTWRGTEQHVYTWQGDRIVAIHGSLAPRHPSNTMPYDTAKTFEYDAQGRIKKLTLDGELPHGEGATADGTVDRVRTFYYDAAGRLERMEADGRGGDVAPENPDGKPDQVMLFSPPCDPIVKLAPQLFQFPELGLPNSIEPPLR